MKFTIALAPMAGYTDLSFRRIASRYGMDYATTEMVSVKALYYGDKKTKRLMAVAEDEAPVGLQLFGEDPAILEQVLADLSVSGGLDAFAFVDLNMGCPAPKIVKTGAGSALMRDLPRAKAMMEAAVKASSVPVTVKVRKGFLEGETQGFEIAKIAQDAGISALTVHGRSREAYYSGLADWDFIGRVSNAVTIPVIGNGDIARAEDIAHARDYGVAGVAIGRGVIGNPFLFRDCKRFLLGEDPLPISDAEILRVAKTHLAWSVAQKGERLGVVEMRKHFIGYLKGFPGAKKLRAEILSLATEAEILKFLDAIPVE